MRNRFRFTSLGVSLLVVLALSCTSHQSPRTVTPDKSAPSRSAAVASGHVGGGEVAQPAEHMDIALRAQAAAVQGKPAYVPALAFGESPAARDLPPAATASDLTDLNREAGEGPDNPEIRHAVPSARPAGFTGDAALQSKAAVPAIPGPIASFDGLNNTDNFNAFGGRVNPSDDNGDVGPNHYVQQINLLVRVYSKAGAPLTPPFKLSSLFAPIGGQCSIQDAGDPIVLYDPLSDRWLLSQFAFASQFAPPYHECIAISKTADPAGVYYVYDFITPGNEFPDYPHIGVWPDAYYMMVHQFTNGGPFNGTGVYAFDRKKMLAGNPAAGFIYFNLNLASHPEGVGGGLFADLDGLTPPPVGRPGIFAYFTSVDFGDPADGIRLFDFHADFAVPANSTFTEPQTTYPAPLPVAAFSLVNPAGRRDIIQPPPASGVTMALDSIADRFMHRLAYRNFGSYETMVTNHTVGAPASTTFGAFRAGVRYYELRRPLPGGLFFVNEQATYAPADGVNRWMASAAMDHEGNIGVGFSVSSTSVFPGIRYAGRLASDPPGGLFQGENLLIAGTGVQTTTNNRWGDYSGMGVDPSDDCTFWFTDEYYTAASQATSVAGWLTRIGSFKVNPDCTAPPMGTLTGNVTFCDTGAPAIGALVEISDGHTAPVTAAGTYSIKLSPGVYSVQVTGPNCTPTAPVSVTITDGGTATLNTCLSGSPSLQFKSVAVTGGNGNGVIDKNECNQLFVTLTNVGCLTDTGITATLSSSTPGVSIDPTAVPYPNIPEGASAANTLPFEVSTSPAFLCGTVINFTETVNDPTGAHVFNFSLPTCTAAPVTFSGSLTTSDAQQNLRIFRDGVQSSCGNPKAACPGTTGTGTRAYDAYNVTNDGGVTACVRVNVSGPCSAGGGSGLNIFSTTYLGSFNPANICQNYLADEGASFGGTGTYFFNLPAGQTAVIVVAEVTQNQGCSAYSLNVSGLLSGTDGGGDCSAQTLTALSPAEVWLGLKNSDDVGTKFDLKAEVYKNGTLIGSGETLNVPGGSSGFNNAKKRLINLALSASGVTFLPGDSLSIKLSVRIAVGVAGHRSGTARLWFNDAQADTQFDTTIGGVTEDWYIRAGGGLQNTPGAGPKTTIDVFVDRLVGGNPYKPFGTWTHTF
jgi:hypothetical protein